MILLGGEGGVDGAMVMSMVVVGERVMEVDRVEGVVKRCVVVVVGAVLQPHRGVRTGHSGYPGRDGGWRDVPRGQLRSVRGLLHLGTKFNTQTKTQTPSLTLIQ